MPLKATISATSKDEADRLSTALIEAGLIAGTLIREGDARFRWEGDIVEERYYNVEGYTVERHRSAIIERVEEIHEDDVPIVEFVAIDGNEKFLDWIEESVADR